MSSIYLIRHGALAGDFGKHHYLGHHEVALSPEGRMQMAAAGEFLTGKGVVTLLSSPLGRCLEGAAIIGDILGLFYRTAPDFREIDLGQWDGRPRSEIKNRFPEAYAARGENISHFRPPFGESFSDLQERVWPAFLATIKTHRHPMAIVSHAGVTRVILCKLLNRNLDTLFTIDQDYGCINILDLHDGVVSCKEVNIVPAFHSL